MDWTVSFFVNGHLQETKQVVTPCTIGRSSQANWVLTHPMLSRNHCILFDKAGELYLRDEGSLNGTHFKGVPANEPVRLQTGDEFTVGQDLKFCVSAPREQEPQTDKIELAEQPTAVFTNDEFVSNLSTLLSDKSAVKESEPK